MDYTSAIFILGILFWVVCALLAVGILAWIYTQLVYLKWNREDRMKECIVNLVNEISVDKPDDDCYDSNDGAASVD